MNSPIRIGTRDSDLALWQARTVEKALLAQGYPCELVPVKATGDVQLDTPLYELGITGIFTRTLDIAMQKGEIDIAVHSMKDVPTALPRGIVQAAVIQRANPRDILVHKGLDFLNTEGIVATGSLRRKAQWLHHYPLHEVTDLRGNVNTRLKKLEESHWNAAIFAAAGLERLGLVPKDATTLHWMVPAPAQGAMMVVANAEDHRSLEACKALNHQPTAICVAVEREFLKTLEGGCTAPIGALATLGPRTLHLQGVLFSLDGQQRLAIEKDIPLAEYHGFGKSCAREILENGGRELMGEIKKQLQS